MGGGGWSRLIESGKPSEDDAVAVQYELTQCWELMA